MDQPVERIYRAVVITLILGVLSPQGSLAQLSDKLIAQGDDASQKIWIQSNVYFGNLRFISGAVDSFEWVEDVETSKFDEHWVLCTNPSEGFKSLTLEY